MANHRSPSTAIFMLFRLVPSKLISQKTKYNDYCDTLWKS